MVSEMVDPTIRLVSRSRPVSPQPELDTAVRTAKPEARLAEKISRSDAKSGYGHKIRGRVCSFEGEI